MFKAGWVAIWLPMENLSLKQNHLRSSELYIYNAADL